MVMTQVSSISNMLHSTFHPRTRSWRPALHSSPDSLCKHISSGGDLHVSQVANMEQHDFSSPEYLILPMFDYFRFLKGVHYSVTLFNVGSVGAVVLIAMVEILGQGACIPPCGQTRWLYSPLWTNKVTSSCLDFYHLEHDERSTYCSSHKKALQATSAYPGFHGFHSAGVLATTILKEIYSPILCSRFFLLLPCNLKRPTRWWFCS